MKILRVLSVALLLAFCVSSTVAQAPALSSADAAAVRAVLDRQIESWNKHDMKMYVADMTPDVTWVNVVGMVWKGRDEVYAAHKAYHETIFKDRGLKPFKQVDLRAATPDVVIATTWGDADGFTSPSGHVYPPSTSVLTYVLVKREGKWWITSAQNTTLDEHAAASNPVKH